MQSHVDEDTLQRAQAEAEAEERDGGAEAIAFEQATRPAEEMQMLIIGFATGMSVAAVFLFYIILAAAHALP